MYRWTTWCLFGIVGTIRLGFGIPGLKCLLEAILASISTLHTQLFSSPLTFSQCTFMAWTSGCNQCLPYLKTFAWTCGTTFVLLRLAFSQPSRCTSATWDFCLGYSKVGARKQVILAQILLTLSLTLYGYGCQNNGLLQSYQTPALLPLLIQPQQK